MAALLKRLRARWDREQFAPSYLGMVVNPFYFARRGLMQVLRPTLETMRGRVLDVGCGRKPYQPWIRATCYVGLDIDTPVTRSLGKADAFFDGKTIPFPDGSFDEVLCSQVFEHVFWPDAFMAEICRVLKPQGRVVLTVPFLWDEHEHPWDFARYSSYGIRAVLEAAGFEIVTHVKSVADFRAVAQLASGWVFKVTLTRSSWLNLLLQVTLIAPLNIAGAVLAFVLPRNADLYLDNVVVARKRDAPV